MRIPVFAFITLLTAVSASGQQADAIQIGNPIATTVQLPTFGVSIDAEGVLEVKAFVDQGGRLAMARAAAAARGVEKGLHQPTEQRKVSLVRLQAELKKLKAAGEPPSEAMKNLAGLTRVTAAYCYPDSGDILIAGPAEPWIEDPSGRTIGMVTGRPTLLLEDVVVALRAYPHRTDHRVFVGCTINPRAEGLANLVRFQRTIPKLVPQRQQTVVTQQVAHGVKKSLGSAEIKVFGISPRTHFARVMLEADYRMKRIAIGVEVPPVRLRTYASALTTAGPGMLERWWFTPDYEGLRMSRDHLAISLTGQGVQLQTENKSIRENGTIVDAARRRPSRATQTFAASFTKRYGDVAKASPVYAQLRQLTDLLILSAYLREYDWYGQASWSPDLFLDESVYSVNSHHQPRSAEVVVNAFWKQNRLFVPAGGGVSIEAELALSNAESADAGLVAQKPVIPLDRGQAWWWD